MVGLYKFYLEEREGMNVIEHEAGFATFKLMGTHCYIRDIYVVPSRRKEHLAAEMANRITQIAKEHLCTQLLGSVCPEAKGSTESIQVLIAYGFRVLKCDAGMIYFIKEI